MSDIPWGATIIFIIFCLMLILAFAESLSRQKTMQNDIKEIRDAVHSVARKTGERIAAIEGQLDQHSSCPVKDRRSTDRRHPEDWATDSNFNPSKAKD